MATIARPKQRVLTLIAVPSNAPKSSGTVTLHPGAAQFTLMWFFDVAGTISIRFVGMDGVARQFATQAVVASTAGLVSFAHNPGDIDLQFTPSSNPATGFIDLTYGGYSGSAG